MSRVVRQGHQNGTFSMCSAQDKRTGPSANYMDFGSYQLQVWIFVVLLAPSVLLIRMDQL